MPPKIPEHLRAAVRLRADFLCEYCHTDERFQFIHFTVDHVVPIVVGGRNDSDNFALACFHCNRLKSDKQRGIDIQTGEEIAYFNPREMKWNDHFCWSIDGTKIISKTRVGEATLRQLQMNRERAVRIRRADLLVDRHPPRGDDREK